MDEFPIFTPVELLGAFKEDSKLELFWMPMAFTDAPIFSDDKEIEFSKISTLRRIAPFVRPDADGVPIYNNRETVERIKPAYIKMEDAVKASEFTGRREVGAGELGAAGQGKALTPQERWLFRIAEITKQHEDAKMIRLEVMCFQALADGIVRVEYDDTGTINNVNFGRDPAHDITLLPGQLWTDPGVNPLNDLTAWRRIMHRPTGPAAVNRFKGRFTMLVMGVDAAEAFRQNEQVREELDVDIANFRGKTIVNAQVLEATDIELIGVLNSGVEVYAYNEYFEDENGDIVNIMDPRDVVALNPRMVKGQIAYGTIESFAADLQSMSMFPNMYSSKDGRDIFLCHESAPMVFPINPNATLRARVV